MSTPGDWISASDALNRYERLLGGRAAAKETLAEHLRDGNLRAIADQKWVSLEPTIKKAWRNESERAEAERNVALQPVLFRSSKRWLTDKSDWRWPFDKASITFRTKPVKRHMFAGLKFASADLVNIAGAPDPRSGGSPGKKEQWVTFWHGMIDLAQAGRLNYSSFPTQAALRKELLESYGIDLSEKSITPATRQIWMKHCKE